MASVAKNNFLSLVGVFLMPIIATFAEKGFTPGPSYFQVHGYIELNDLTHKWVPNHNVTLIQVTSHSSPHILKSEAASTPDRWSSPAQSRSSLPNSETSNPLLQTFFKPANPHDIHIDEDDANEVEIGRRFENTKKNRIKLDHKRGDIDLSAASKKAESNSSGTDFYVINAPSPVEQFFGMIKAGFQLILMFIVGNMMTVFNPFGFYFPHE